MGYDLLVVGHEYPTLPAWRAMWETLDCDVATFQHWPDFAHRADAFSTACGLGCTAIPTRWATATPRTVRFRNWRSTSECTRQSSLLATATTCCGWAHRRGQGPASGDPCRSPARAEDHRRRSGLRQRLPGYAPRAVQRRPCDRGQRRRRRSQDAPARRGGCPRLHLRPGPHRGRRSHLQRIAASRNPCRRHSVAAGHHSRHDTMTQELASLLDALHGVTSDSQPLDAAIRILRRALARSGPRTDALTDVSLTCWRGNSSIPHE
jgi:hypothetical protein